MYNVQASVQAGEAQFKRLQNDRPFEESNRWVTQSHSLTILACLPVIGIAVERFVQRRCDRIIEVCKQYSTDRESLEAAKYITPDMVEKQIWYTQAKRKFHGLALIQSLVAITLVICLIFTKVIHGHLAMGLAVSSAALYLGYGIYHICQMYLSHMAVNHPERVLKLHSETVLRVIG